MKNITFARQFKKLRCKTIQEAETSWHPLKRARVLGCVNYVKKENCRKFKGVLVVFVRSFRVFVNHINRYQLQETCDFKGPGKNCSVHACGMFTILGDATK